ncbi:MAG: phosphoribosylanthranilate isomerase [Vampirovibrionales bacterium]|nr:phosphoribosylanthranilate isomerase [Vampirovibrionales bacterium]
MSLCSKHPAAFFKTCGITSIEDAHRCLEAGASALGLIFVPETPRYVSVQRAKAIRAAIPSGIACVGVFQNQSIDEIQSITDQVGLHAVQLHGIETPDAFSDLAVPMIKTLFLRKPHWPLKPMIAAWQRPARQGRLMAWLIEDALKQPQSLHWSEALNALALPEDVPIWIAGGLTPDNVSSVWQQASGKVFGLDVAGGIEASAGIKSPEKLLAWQQALAGSFRLC